MSSSVQCLNNPDTVDVNPFFITGILCPRGAGEEGSPGIIPGQPVLLWCSGILCHSGAGGEGSPGIIPGEPVLLRCSGILCHSGLGGKVVPG